jgi:hypothetical protein
LAGTSPAWHMFGFPIHERDLAVIHLAIHIEKGQRVFFTSETEIDRATNSLNCLNCVFV